MSNKAYVYDPITREFVGVARLDRDPLGGWYLGASQSIQGASPSRRSTHAHA